VDIIRTLIISTAYELKLILNERKIMYELLLVVSFYNVKGPYDTISH